MKYFSLIAFSALLLAACGGPGQQHDETLPAACEMLTVEQLESFLQEPVQYPTPTNVNVGERSACSYVLPGRAGSDNLVVMVLDSHIRKDAGKFDELIAEWKERYLGSEYEQEKVSGYPMAFFPGVRGAFPPTFLISFEQADLAIQGAGKDAAKSIAFRIMVQYQWK